VGGVEEREQQADGYGLDIVCEQLLDDRVKFVERQGCDHAAIGRDPFRHLKAPL
jgi:hypothetical protein